MRQKLHNSALFRMFYACYYVNRKAGALLSSYFVLSFDNFMCAEEK